MAGRRIAPRLLLARMDEDEKYAFDTGGYVVLRQLLTPNEVKACNQAISAMVPEFGDIRGSESYSGSSPLMRGRHHLFNRLAGKIATLRAGANAAEVARAMHAAAAEASELVGGAISVVELQAALARFKLDDGWKLQPAQVKSLLESAQLMAREELFEPAAGRPHRLSEPVQEGLLSVGCSNWRISGQLEWPQPHCLPFRELLCHPRLQPILDTVLGPGYRLDHGPYIAIMRDGCDGHNLHGGAHERFSGSGFLEGYQFHAGHWATGLTVVEVKLHDHCQGDGGLCVVPGSVRVPTVQYPPLHATH